MAIDPLRPSQEFLDFWREPRLGTLTTVRPDGTPHVVPVGITYDPSAGLARITSQRGSVKVRNIEAAGPAGAAVAVCQCEGPRWSTLEGRATINADPDAVADAVTRYADRYGRTPSFNPERVVIQIALTRAMGSVR